MYTTEKLYDNDSYLTEFKCKVIHLYTDDRYIYVITDRTAFFPEGGGQSSDRGWLNGCNVENVQIIDGNIVHFVENCEENARADFSKWDKVLEKSYGERKFIPLAMTEEEIYARSLQ